VTDKNKRPRSAKPPRALKLKGNHRKRYGDRESGIIDYDKITILMHEYDTLRDEIIQRNNALQQQNSIAAVVLFGTLTIAWSGNVGKYQSYILYGLLALCFLIFIYGIWFAFRETDRVIVRLRQIEADVNQRAGETLLQWETHWGWSAINHWGRAKPHHRTKNISK
jgi:hypothetical protein